MEALKAPLELRLEVAEKSLDFLEPGSSRIETCGAINTDLYRLYALRDQLDQLVNNDLAGWRRELAVASRVQEKVRNGLAQSQNLHERVSLVKFPANDSSQQHQITKVHMVLDTVTIYYVYVEVHFKRGTKLTFVAWKSIK